MGEDVVARVSLIGALLCAHVIGHAISFVKNMAKALVILIGTDVNPMAAMEVANDLRLEILTNIIQ